MVMNTENFHEPIRISNGIARSRWPSANSFVPHSPSHSAPTSWKTPKNVSNMNSASSDTTTVGIRYAVNTTAVMIFWPVASRLSVSAIHSPTTSWSNVLPIIKTTPRPSEPQKRSTWNTWP